MGNQYELEVEDCGESFEDIYSKPYFPKELEASIKSSQILILPYENFRNGYDILFPEFTDEFYYFVKENLDKDYSIEVVVSDEDFLTLEMHSTILNIPRLFIKHVVFPVIISLISSYIYDYAKHYNETVENINVRLEIICEKQDGRRSTIKYEGPAEHVKVLNELIDKAKGDK